MLICLYLYVLFSLRIYKYINLYVIFSLHIYKYSRLKIVRSLSGNQKIIIAPPPPPLKNELSDMFANNLLSEDKRDNLSANQKIIAPPYEKCSKMYW